MKETFCKWHSSLSQQREAWREKQEEFQLRNTDAALAYV